MTYTRPTKGKPATLKELRTLYDQIVSGEKDYRNAGAELGVSDNAVRKWFKTAGWELPKKNLPQVEFTCDHCSKKFMREHNTLKNSRHGFHYCNPDCQYAGAKKRRHAINSTKK